MAGDVRVTVLGLSELSRAFTKVARTDFRQRLGSVANVIAGRVAAAVPLRTGRLAASIRPRSSTRGAAVAAYGSAAAYGPFIDFGGSVGRNHSIRRPFIKEGRYLYPTIRDARGDIEGAVQEAILDTARREDFETR